MGEWGLEASSVFRRYLLIQAPGWVLAAIVLYWLHRWLALPYWAVAALLIAEVAKDFLLYPKLKRAYEAGGDGAADALVGREAVAREALDPEGYVALRGELWRARAAEGRVVEPGERVRVLAAEGLLLRVEPASDQAQRR